MLRSLLEVVELEFEGQPARVDGFRLRNLENWRTARETSLLQNLGSLSTVCNCRCQFCYEDGNPPGLFEKSPPFVSLREAETRRRYLHDGKGLLREGKGFFEPLMNPDFLALLGLAREDDSAAVIDVTTNGALLTAEIVNRLSELEPVVVNLSLISADAATRRDLMGDRRAETAIRAVELLREARLPFMGTLVPLPHQSLDDVEATLEYLDAHQARMVRVSMPGLTRHHREYAPGVIEAWVPEVIERVQALRERLQTPIIISPFAHVSASLEAAVEGVIRCSPAATAGMRVGDRILALDGTEVVSRTHAVSLIRRATARGSVEVEFLRGDERMRARLEEPANEADAYPYKPRGWRPLNFPGLSFGLCLPGAFHLQYLRQIHDAMVEKEARYTLVAASSFFRETVGALLEQLPVPEGSRLEVVVPRNEFFGGTVSVGDLWVLEDIERAVRPYLDAIERPDLLVLPDSFLSHWGRDLRGIPYTELEARLGIDIALVACERIMM